MAKLWAVINALYHGKSLDNAEAWKHTQNAVNAIIIVLTAILQFVPDLTFTDAQLTQIANVIVMIGAGIVNVYFTVATTDKIGIKPKK